VVRRMSFQLQEFYPDALRRNTAVPISLKSITCLPASGHMFACLAFWMKKKRRPIAFCAILQAFHRETR